MTLAAWCRIFLPESIDLIIAAFFLCGIGVGFALNTILKFCHEWFPEDKRPFFYSFLTLGTLLGSGLGPILPFIFISDSNEISKDKKKEEIMLYMWITTIIITVQFVLAFIFIKTKKPDEFISLTNENKEPLKNDIEEATSEIEEKSFCGQLLSDTKGLFTDCNFLKVLFLITVSKGSFLLLNSILVIIITNLNYDKVYGSATVVIGLTFGLTGSIFYSKKFSQRRNQKFYLSLFLSLSLLVLTIGYIFIYYNFIVIFIIAYSVSGFFSYPMIPMYFAVASQNKFNSSLSSVNSYMMLFPQLSTFLLQLISSACFKLFGEEGSFMVFLFIIALYILSLIVLGYIKTK